MLTRGKRKQLCLTHNAATSQILKKQPCSQAAKPNDKGTYLMKTAFDFLPPLLVNAFHQETEIGRRLSDSICMFKEVTPLIKSCFYS